MTFFAASRKQAQQGLIHKTMSPNAPPKDLFINSIESNILNYGPKQRTHVHREVKSTSTDLTIGGTYHLLDGDIYSVRMQLDMSWKIYTMGVMFQANHQQPGNKNFHLNLGQSKKVYTSHNEIGYHGPDYRRVGILDGCR
jgi:hypothetical protein